MFVEVAALEILLLLPLKGRCLLYGFQNKIYLEAMEVL